MTQAANADLPFLELRGVRKAFRPGVTRKIQVFDELTCSFRLRRCTAMLGHNGAGKTTAIRILLGLIGPDQGEVVCEGRPMQRQDRRRIGFMPEVSKMPNALTVEEALSHQLRLFGTKMREVRARVDAKLAEVELTEHRKKRIGQLSKGLARRVAWSQATIHAPEFLILDEPFSGLEPLARAGLQDLMTGLRQQGVGMLICTHEFWSVRELCDELLIMNRGKIVFSQARSDTAKPWPEERSLMTYFATKD